MHDLTPTPPIMSVHDFRKITGEQTKHLTDAEVEHIISHLDLMADMYITRVKARKEDADNEQP